MNLSAITVGTWWPIALTFLAMGLLLFAWFRMSGTLFPDLRVVRDSASAAGIADRLPLVLGSMICLLLPLSLMNISATRMIEVDRHARDFLVIVDTSRSMRENTALLRKDYQPVYPRKADLYVGQSDDPENIPNLGRYEVARTSLLQFLASRNEVDRIGLIYFNSMVYLMSGFTSNFDFVERQLAGMDPYVTFGTNMRWALQQALDLVERYPGRNRRAIILLTDAEARNTEDLQLQLARARKLDIAFYLLWIQPETGEAESPLATEFLRTVREFGSVFTIDEISEGFLDDAFGEISQLEDYAYREARHQRVDLSRIILSMSLWLTLLWVLCQGTLWTPLRKLASAGSGHD